MSAHQPKSLWTSIKSSLAFWVKPQEFTKSDKVLFVVVNTLLINIVVALSAIPESLITGVSPVKPAISGVIKATPIVVIMMTLGLNSFLELMRLRSDMEEVSKRLAERNAELEATKAELDKLANSDVLTGVANRRAFYTYLDDMFDPETKPEGDIWLAMLDLDGFKMINDTHGHDAGDEVLKSVAQRLEDTFAKLNGKIARLGGDEFAMLLPDPKADRSDIVERRARALGAYLSSDHEYDGVPLEVGVSIGLVRLDERFETPHAFLKAADAALLRAKAGGKGRVCRYGADLAGKASLRDRLLRRG